MLHSLNIAIAGGRADLRPQLDALFAPLVERIRSASLAEAGPLLHQLKLLIYGRNSAEAADRGPREWRDIYGALARGYAAACREPGSGVPAAAWLELLLDGAFLSGDQAAWTAATAECRRRLPDVDPATAARLRPYLG